MDQQPLYKHLLSPDYPHSTLLPATLPLLTGCIGMPKQEELIKSDDTNTSAQIHTIYPETAAIRDECKQRAQVKSDWNQWFDDEFASIYRQYQRQHRVEEKQEKSKSTANSINISHPTTQSSSAKKYSPKPLHQHNKNATPNPSLSSIALSTTTTTTTTTDFDSLPSDQISLPVRYASHPPPQAQQPLRPFPWPESVEQIYAWCRVANKSKDVKSQTKLCRRLLATLVHFDVNANQVQTSPNLQRRISSRGHAATPPRSLESSTLSLPSLSSSSTSESLSSSSAPSIDNSHIRHVMMRECLRILKRQSFGQVLGKGGDSEAQFILANCYGRGLLGLTEDHSKAFQLFMQASKQAHPEATYRTAVCYELGIGTRKDGQRAMIFYRKSAHLSHAGSMYKLGMILLHGYYNTTPLPREAISWFQRAASHVTTTTSPVAYKAPTVKPSLSRAASSSSLSSLHSTTNKGHQRSQSIIAKATSQVYHHQTPHALHALAMIQMREEISNTTSLIADSAYAIELLHQAAKRDHVPSQLQLGHCFEHGQWVAVDEALSIYWYARAAQLESPEGCLAISCWYLTGTTKKNVLQPSDREAYLWARRAIALAVTTTFPTDRSTMAKAHFTVAVLLERGVDNDRVLNEVESAKKTRTWMLKAAALGHQGASQWLQDKQVEDY